MKKKNNLLNEYEIDCVQLEIPSTHDEYHTLLSKHTRQNLRTSRNRAEKDGISFRINYDDQNVDKEICRKMREIRVREKLLREYNSRSFVRKLKYRVWKFMEDQYPEFLPFLTDKNSKLLTVYDGDTLCGYFNYGIDAVHKTIVIMAVGINEDYARYSPGMIAFYSFIRSKIEEGVIKCVDFTRGDEPYKFALGGKVTKISTLQVMP